MSTTPSLTSQLSAAVGARKNSIIALRARIAALLAPIPIGVKLSDEQGLVVKIARVCTGASQWSNRTWDVTIKGRGMIDADGNLLAEYIDKSYFDGDNLYHRTTEPTCLGSHPDFGDYDSERGLSWASGKDTRAIAARLPQAIANYMSECEAERAANEATLAAAKQ